MIDIAGDEGSGVWSVGCFYVFVESSLSTLPGCVEDHFLLALLARFFIIKVNSHSGGEIWRGKIWRKDINKMNSSQSHATPHTTLRQRLNPTCTYTVVPTPSIP